MFRQGGREIDSEIYDHMGENWFSLKPYDQRDIFKAEVNPLNGELIDEIIDSIVSHDPQRRGLVQRLHDSNAKFLASSDTVSLVLDGRSNGAKEGYLGDMIEASRFVDLLRRNGKRVVIFTSHEDLFQGTWDSEISVLPLPDRVWTSRSERLKPKFLKYIYSQVGDAPCVFPMNANLPVLIIPDRNGYVHNKESLIVAREAFRPNAQRMLITRHIWGENGVHQLQALQITANLMGIDDARYWQQFPQAFLHPTQYAQEVAAEVVRIYGCFNGSKGCPPIYLHPGVAISDRKLKTKFYPEDRWSEVIQRMAVTPHISNSLTFLEPSDPDQGDMTSRLAAQAVESGLHVAKVPMSSVKKHYVWTLGSFVAFLQELSKHRGIVLGCDSMPAGHAGSATKNPSIVLASLAFNPAFYCPPEKALVVIPTKSPLTSSIDPERVVSAIQHICLDPNLQYKH